MGFGKGNGKGQGGCGLDDMLGGGCFEMFYESMCKFVCCICCILTFGFVLMIVGIVFLASATTDTRGNNINEFNNAVSTFTTSVAPFSALTSMTAQIGNAAAATLAKNVPPDTIEPAKSGETINSDYPKIAFSGTPALPTTAASAPTSLVTLTLLVGTSSLTMSFAPVKSVSYSQADLSCTSSSGSTSIDTKCTNACNSRGGVYSTTTKVCTANQAIQSLCLLVHPSSTTPTSPTTWTLSSGGCSETFPRMQQTTYGSSSTVPAAVTVTVRHDQDPWLVYLRFGKDFGLTQGQKVVIGIVLLVIGSCWELVVCGCVYFVLYPIYKRKVGGQQQAAGVSQSTMTGVTTQPVMAQPQMMQQPMMQPMGMQQPMYGGMQPQPMGMQTQPMGMGMQTQPMGMGMQQQPMGMGMQQQPMGMYQQPQYGMR